MRRLERLSRSNGACLGVTGGIFALMFLLNLLTPYICDDYTYHLNFLTREPLGSFREIIPSMYAHSYKMNGRLISHGLAQVFMLLPPVVFDLCNAAVFAGTLYLVQRLCFRERNGLLLAAAFCLLWLFTPSFGQVALWQVGAINYFWSLAAFALFIVPALLRFRDGQELLKTKWQWAAFCVYGFFFGWYNEIASFVGICMVPCLVVLDVWMNRQKFAFFRLLPVLTAALGYLTMFAMPAQSVNKQGAALTLEVLLEKAENCARMLWTHCAPLLLLLTALFLLGLLRGLSGKTLVQAGLFALAGICANFMPIAASYYPERCMCTTVLLLVMACLTLSAPLGSGKGFPILAAGCALLLALTLPSGLSGCRDIMSCHRQNKQREETIAAALVEGNRDVIANAVIPSTPYSGFYGLRDLTNDPDTWPNHSMAVYYGLDSLITE